MFDGVFISIFCLALTCYGIMECRQRRKPVRPVQWFALAVNVAVFLFDVFLDFYRKGIL